MYYIYLISSEINDQKLYKIGFTRRKVEDRINDFRTGNISNFEIIETYKSIYGTKIERLLHGYYKVRCISGEWFSLTQDDIEKFIPMCEMYHSNFKILESNTYLQDKIKLK